MGLTEGNHSSGRLTNISLPVSQLAFARFSAVVSIKTLGHVLTGCTDAAVIVASMTSLSAQSLSGGCGPHDQLAMTTFWRPQPTSDNLRFYFSNKRVVCGSSLFERLLSVRTLRAFALVCYFIIFALSWSHVKLPPVKTQYFLILQPHNESLCTTVGERPSLCGGCPKSGNLLNFTGLLLQVKKAIKATLCDQSEELGRRDIFGTPFH